MVSFKKRVDGLLTGAEVRERRKRLNLMPTTTTPQRPGPAAGEASPQSDESCSAVSLSKSG
jgi:hypothetical protein